MFRIAFSLEEKPTICVSALPSARVPAPHIRSQHVQAITTRGFIQSVLVTMGIMMPETC